MNNKCYGTQLQRLLKTPLTPLQNALARLEKGRIIISHCEGKTKLYQLNPTYPLLAELEQLLKKAYTLLPPHEKKLYALVQQDSLERRVQIPSLRAFWDRLKQVQHCTYLVHFRSKNDNGWRGKGKGDVLIHQPTETILILHERGEWQTPQGQDMGFSNTFRWTLDQEAGMIALEHLRFGLDKPIFLFYLMPTGPHLLASVESHLCEEDVYLASVPWDHQSIRLNWRVIGPKKNEELEYCYI